MKDYIKPEVEYVNFTNEEIADGAPDIGGGSTSNNINNFS